MQPIPNTSGKGLSQRASATKMNPSSKPGDKESNLESKKKSKQIHQDALRAKPCTKVSLAVLGTSPQYNNFNKGKVTLQLT